jgi:UDP-N-acetylglucosamine:LPS N-acetylglucosamine transferase
LIVEDRHAVEELIEVALKLLNDTDKRVELGNNIAKLAKPTATEDIAKEILKLAEQH